MSDFSQQLAICERFNSACCIPDQTARLGIALSSLNQQPLNALRLIAEGDACGWYIWGGEFQQAADFFNALCVEHAIDHVPLLLPYLGLAPGWRVLLAPDQVDVWYDAGLLGESK